MPYDPVSAPTLAIIGGGFSGALTAVQLLRQAPGANFQLILIERRARAARGLAYSTADDNLLLNVPAGNMSALPEAPDHFLDYCRAVDPAFSAGSFVSRRLYGDYLEQTLAQAEASRPHALTRRHGEALAIHRCAASARFRIALDDGSVIAADRVVLALGHNRCKQLDDGRATGSAADGWSWPLPPAGQSAAERLPVVIAGSGHTALDTVFRLTSQHDSCSLLLVSRRGLLPHAHRSRPQPPATGEFPRWLRDIAPTALAHLRAIRAEVRRRSADAGDWRDVINELRPHTPAIWQRLPPAQRERFLTHLAPYWDVHRHRLAPIAEQRLRTLRERGQLRVVAGRIGAAEPCNDGALRIALRRRGSSSVERIEAAALINCTGPGYDLHGNQPPLMAQLRDAGWLAADALRTGLVVDDHYQPVGRDGRSVAGLYYIGPLLRARYWEATAVPELRQHARALADEIIRAWLPSPAESASTAA